MKQKMNIITLLVFLYAGIVCAVVKPETRSGIVKIETNDSSMVSASSVYGYDTKPNKKVSTRTLLVLGIR